MGLGFWYNRAMRILESGELTGLKFIEEGHFGDLGDSFGGIGSSPAGDIG